MGGNTFTLDPTKFGVIVTTNKAGTSPYGAQALTPEQKSSFHKEDVHSNRKNTTFTAGYNFDPEWNIKFEFNHLDQSGAKLTSAATDASHNIVPTFSSGGSSYAPKGQAILLLMNPTNYKTDSGNLALNWVGEKGHFSGSYVFSLFRDANNTLAF